MGPWYRAKIVIVAAETAATREFMNYAWGLQLGGQLDRIVLDECHVVLSSATFRTRLQRLKRLEMPCQYILLTGTLPPCMTPELERMLLLEEVEYIRAGTSRSNFGFRVETCEDDDIEEEVMMTV